MVDGPFFSDVLAVLVDAQLLCVEKGVKASIQFLNEVWILRSVICGSIRTREEMFSLCLDYIR